MTAKKALVDFAQSLGGSILEVSREDFSLRVSKSIVIDGRTYYDPRKGFSHAPFSSDLAIKYKEKTLYVVDTNEDYGSWIHELGHIFASKRAPNTSNEWSFFGWEYAVALKLDLVEAWKDSTKYYNIPDRTVLRSTDWSKTAASKIVFKYSVLEFGRLEPREMAMVLEDTLKKAKKRGIVSEAGEPLSVCKS